MPHSSSMRSLLLSLVILGVAGCRERIQPSDVTIEVPETATNDKSMESDRRQLVAMRAKDTLFKQLSGRLVSVMQSDGPAAAIDVCSKEAVSIAEAVGKEHGVKIGRTSFKLRNPNNAPRDWVKPLVEKRTETPEFVQLDDGSLGALYPIYINVKCLMCHGRADDILDAVKAPLAKLYPEDGATGFKLDELRGWFWVEVPEGNSSSRGR